MVERILYLLLILIALLSGAYGYISGFFTPHHYYELHNVLDSCDKPLHIYVNEREDYLLRMKTYKSDGLTIKNTKTITTKYKKIFEDDLHEMYRIENENAPMIQTFRRNKIDNSFLEEAFLPSDLTDLDLIYSPNEKITTLHKTCKVTKQFLQRN